MWNKIEKSRKIGQGKKNLTSIFVGFFNCYCQKLVFGIKIGHYAMSPP